MATARKTATENEGVVVPGIDLRTLQVRVIGDSQYVSHKWSEKAINMIKDKQGGKPKQGKGVKVPTEEYKAAFYTTPEGKFGIPSIAFKQAMVSAAKDVDLKMTDMRRRFHIRNDLVEIVSDEPVMRQDMVRVGMGVADIRYRPEFNNWHVDLIIDYNASVITPGQILNLLNVAGFGVGVGEWRPEKNGQWGRFHVAREEDIAA